MEKVIELLEAILREMNLEAEITTAVEEDVTTINVHGKDLGLLIGRQGHTLDALQCILSAMANRNVVAEHRRLILDIEGYRSRQQKDLEELAKRMAEKVVYDGTPITLRPMSPFERRIIHLTLRDSPEVETMSEGEEPDRKVTISPKEPQ